MRTDHLFYMIMENKNLLNDLFHRLNASADENGLVHISKLDFNGTHPLTRFHEVTDGRMKINDIPLFLYDDFFFISNDLVHFTAFLFLLRPFINNAIREDGAYHQNWYDARYLSYASALHYAVYNFWDRIGDLLYTFFETGLNEGSVYIGRVLNNFPKKHRDSAAFQQLDDVFRNQVQPLIFERNEDAHNKSIPTSHFYEILLAKADNQQQKTELKLSLPDQFKEQIELAYRGFELALCLIEERGERS